MQLISIQAILNALVVFGRNQSSIFDEIQLPLVTFFYTYIRPNPKHPNGTLSLSHCYNSHVVKGSKVFGPFVQLPREIQRMALAVIYYFPKLESSMQKSLLACCLHDQVTPDMVLQIIELAQHHHQKGGMDLDHYASFLVALQVGLGKKRDFRNSTNNKRKRETPDPNPSTNATTNNKQILERVEKISAKVCWEFAQLCSVHSPINIMQMIQQIIEQTLVC